MDTNFNHKTVHKIHKKLKKCLAAGPTIPEGFSDKNKTLIMNDANGSGSCGGIRTLLAEFL